MEDKFWQVTFWGLIGTISGVLGLVVSWLSWRYTHPNIKITHLALKMREYDDEFIRSNIEATPEELTKIKNNQIRICLDIKIANKKGGAGAIEKPVLVFKIKKAKEICIDPVTKSYSTTRISETYSETETINLGKAFNIKGGEILDDQLEYIIRGQDGALQVLISNYKDGKFYIRYHTNFGKKYEKMVKISLTKYL